MSEDRQGATRGLKAFLLAAGLGTRLRPITDSRPKCLVEVGGRTMLDIWLDALAAAGVDEVLVNTHHLAPLVAAQVVERRQSAPVVRVSHEPQLLGSAGTLLANRKLVEDEEMFLVVNADNLTDFDLRQLIDGHRAGGAVATWSVFRAPRPSECGVVEVDDDGWVIGFTEKPPAPRGDLANAGMYAFGPQVLEEISTPLPRDIGFDLLGRLVGRARAVDIGDSYFIDIGTPAALESARQHRGRVTA
ncbi:nucleotidyltransferase family protein [Pedococcus sp. KACC 23699]|uniref:Nucleotidyltransferase family protein n=1 Tax=Pedococcus sp. KACC 23699 TaxID=3149228 RepID=A0AAU7JX06_9MICO